VPHRGKRNESSFLQHIAEKLAEVKGTTFDTVDKITSENALKLFKH
jgi:TatD DNase family protein